MKISEALGKSIRQRREECGWNVQALATAIYTSSRTIYRYELSMKDVDALEAIAIALETTDIELLVRAIEIRAAAEQSDDS